MECSVTLYDKTGPAENVHIVVPLDSDNDKSSSADMLKLLPIFQQRINDVLTAKIGDNCAVVEPTEEQNEDQE
ncbi:hypothetical protein TSMEX_006553 [Taenia solium]|eukprot:TsM_000682600 transcript=TsM_000682600 gene=TsM_000682600